MRKNPEAFLVQANRSHQGCVKTIEFLNRRPVLTNEQAAQGWRFSNVTRTVAVVRT